MQIKFDILHEFVFVFEDGLFHLLHRPLELESAVHEPVAHVLVDVYVQKAVAVWVLQPAGQAAKYIPGHRLTFGVACLLS
jgi:hypothetical protein